MPPNIAKSQEINGTNIHSMYYFNTLNRICTVEDRSILEHHYQSKKTNAPLDTDSDIVNGDMYENMGDRERVRERGREREYENVENIYVVYNEIKVVNNEESEQEQEQVPEPLPIQSRVIIEEIQDHVQDDGPIVEEVEDIQRPQIQVQENVVNTSNDRDDDDISIISQTSSTIKNKKTPKTPKNGKNKKKK
jgi:hypothetical protein